MFFGIGASVARFPSLGIDCRGFPALEPVTSFPALGSDYVIRPYYYKKIRLVVALRVSIYYKRVLKREENRIKTFSLPPVLPETRATLTSDML